MIKTREKRQQYTPVITRTFDLEHLDGKAAVTILRLRCVNLRRR